MLIHSRVSFSPAIVEQEVDKRAPITVKYEIPYFTVSGIQVRYLKIVEKSGYQALPWVRYITQNGDDYRCAPLLGFVCNAKVDRCIFQSSNSTRQGHRRTSAYAIVDLECNSLFIPCCFHFVVLV